MRPLLHMVPAGPSAQRVLLSYSRRPLTGSPVSPRTPSIPPLTAEQSDALDTLHFTAAAHSLSIQLQAGDMQFWNNFALLHAREGFVDGSEPATRRHLLRLRLRDDDRAAEWGFVPDALRATWDDAFGPAPPGVAEQWPVEPVRDRAFVIEQRRSSGFA